MNPAGLPNRPLSAIACLATTTDELSTRVQVAWQPFEEDGLGEGLEALFVTDQGMWFGLQNYRQSPRNDLVEIWGENSEPGRTVDHVLIALGLDSSLLRWVAPDVQLTGHSLFREDDNGVRFHVANYACRADAEAKAAALGWGGHKQVYFIEPLELPTVRLEFDPNAMKPPAVVSVG